MTKKKGFVTKPEKSFQRDFFASRVSYNPETGIFTWLNAGRSGEHKVGDALRPNRDGYVKARLGGDAGSKMFSMHRVAYLLMTGGWPEHVIDHINHNKSDNRWCNLRAVTHRQNIINMSMNKSNKSGHRGVCWDNRNKKWIAAITVNYKSIRIGNFLSKEEAISAYEKEAEKHFGEFYKSSAA